MLSIVLPMVLFAIASCLSPGPVNVLAASTGARTGIWGALPYVAGASGSLAIIVWLVGSGLNHVLRNHPAVTQALQFVGAAYLLYLAVKIARAQPVSQLQHTEQLASLMRGFWSQTLNPKAWLVALSGISLYVTTQPGRQGVLLLFCAICGLVCFVSVASWAAMGMVIGRWLDNARFQMLFNRTMAALLALTVLAMLAST